MVNVKVEDAIHELMNACGNCALAAERLNRSYGLPPDDALKPQDVQELAAKDMPRLKRAIQASMLTQLFSTFDVAISAIASSIPAMKPTEAVHASQQVLNLLNAMTDDKTSRVDINVNEYAWSQLTPEFKEILAALKLAEPNGTLIEASEDDSPWVQSDDC